MDARPRSRSEVRCAGPRGAARRPMRIRALRRRPASGIQTRMLPRVKTLLALLGLAALPFISPAAERVIAYAVEAGAPGGQAFGGVLGMDFNVTNPILVTQLGVFDDGSDGLNLPLVARIFDRTDPLAPVELVAIDFTP